MGSVQLAAGRRSGLSLRAANVYEGSLFNADECRGAPGKLLERYNEKGGKGQAYNFNDLPRRFASSGGSPNITRQSRYAGKQSKQCEPGSHQIRLGYGFGGSR